MEKQLHMKGWESPQRMDEIVEQIDEILHQQREMKHDLRMLEKKVETIFLDRSLDKIVRSGKK